MGLEDGCREKSQKTGIETGQDCCRYRDMLEKDVIGGARLHYNMERSFLLEYMNIRPGDLQFIRGK